MADSDCRSASAAMTAAVGSKRKRSSGGGRGRTRAVVGPTPIADNGAMASQGI